MVAVGTDHHPFDRLVRWIDRWAGLHPGAEVMVQRGTSAPTEHCASTELLAHGELCERFAMAVVVVTHGGPSTVMDARMGGRLPIVVPRDPALGEHVDDHQQRFANHLRLHDLARVADDETTLHRFLDEAMAAPDRYAVPIDSTSVGGVVEFGHQVDRLLGIATPLVPTSPATIAEERRVS
jgi:UDP-N-acetylglucosamine transferase subunit ALG13